MKIRVALMPSLVHPPAIEGDVLAIVIDTLRFTSTACQALHAGASRLWIGSEIQQVRSSASEYQVRSGGRVVLCGERLCRPIPGFDMGNSPWEYSPDAVRSAELFFTTTNGTRAVAAAKQAQAIWLSALVNRSATVQKLLATNPAKAWIVCAGTDGQIALEDVLACGALVSLALKLDPQNVLLDDDASRIALSTWKDICPGADESPRGEDIRQQFQRALGGRNLVESGYEADLQFAAQLDVLNVVPESKPPHWQQFAASHG